MEQKYKFINRQLKISCGHMFRLHAQPLPPPAPISKLDRRHTGRLRKRNKSLKGEGGRGWAWSRII